MTAAENNPIEQDWIVQREQAVAWLRVVFSLAAVVVIQLNPSRVARFPILSEFSLGSFLLYSFGALYLARKYRVGAIRLGTVSTALDVIWIALIVNSTGGTRTPFFFYFSFPIITASLRWGLKGSLAVALAGVTTYSLMRLTLHAESIGAPLGIDSILVRDFYLIALGAIFGFVSEFEKKQNQKLLALSQTAAQVGALQERRRIAYELHDGILQTLATLILRLETCRHQQGRADTPIEHELRDIEDITRGAMKEIRHFLAGKDTQPLVQGTLAERLREELRFLRDGMGIRAILETEPEDLDLSIEIERELYYVLREGLTNVTRHSHATHVEITLLQRGKLLQGVLADDGIGIDLSANGAARGVGLKSMKERLKKLGGEFEIKSSPGAGTNISFVVPLAN